MARIRMARAWIVAATLLPASWAGCGGDEFTAAQPGTGGAGGADASTDAPSQGGSSGAAGKAGAANGGAAGAAGTSTGGAAGEASGGAAGEAGGSTGGSAGASTGGAAGSANGGAAGDATGGGAGAAGSANGGAAGSANGGAAGAATGGAAGAAGGGGSGGGSGCAATEECAPVPSGGWGQWQLVSWFVEGASGTCAGGLDMRHAPGLFPPPPKCTCTCGEIKGDCQAAFACASPSGSGCAGGAYSKATLSSECQDLSVDAMYGLCGVGNVGAVGTCDRGATSLYDDIAPRLGECAVSQPPSCSSGGRCAAMKPTGAIGGPCIRLAGGTALDCPAPYTKRHDTYLIAEDKRVCAVGDDNTGCTCKVATGTCANTDPNSPGHALLTQGGCTNSFTQVMLTPGWSCKQLGSGGGTTTLYGAKLKNFTPTFSVSSCQTNGSPSVSGDIGWDSAETLCCMP
ncbi:MAG TPA: hypothetical protein PLI95_04235 [Polyangiaceae bacterium]|nr:hypothetical protein [Polyangiaceae bacterium]